jgi:hypothetical protein
MQVEGEQRREMNSMSRRWVWLGDKCHTAFATIQAAKCRKKKSKPLEFGVESNGVRSVGCHHQACVDHRISCISGAWTRRETLRVAGTGFFFGVAFSMGKRR